MRRPLVVGNWKMFHGGRSSVALAEACVRFAEQLPAVDLAVAPPFTALAAVSETIEGSPVQLGAQNLHPNREGPFTGEISGSMLRECGCTWVIVGHSERRGHFGETNATVRDKVSGAIDSGLRPIVCVGETLAQRKANETLLVIKQQVESFLEVFAASPLDAAIAYEPVWAIGTGQSAGPREAEEVHQAIREWLRSKDSNLAEKTRLLYGGSVNADNAASILACDHVDGVLVGGASLDPAAFGAIAGAASR